MGMRDLMKKENLENISLPFRLVGPVLTILIFLSQIWIGVFNHFYQKYDDEFRKNIEFQYKTINDKMGDIKTSVKDLSLTVNTNNTAVMTMFKENADDKNRMETAYRDWRESVEKQLEQSRAQERRLSLIEGMMFGRKNRNGGVN